MFSDVYKIFPSLLKAIKNPGSEVENSLMSQLSETNLCAEELAPAVKNCNQIKIYNQ